MRELKRYTWGSIDYGKLGHSLKILEPEVELRSNSARSEINISQIRQPKRVDVLPNGLKIKRVICRYNNTFLIDESGKVYVLGNTEKGSNGTGRLKGYIKEPTLVSGFDEERIAEIDCGNSFCVARSESGKVFSWGFNNYGQLGNSPNHCEFKPVKLDNFAQKVSQVTCGEYFSAALDTDGNAYTWGRGDSGQLGHGNSSDLDAPKRIDFPVKFSKISAGDTHLMLLGVNGEVFVTGNGRDGQIGRGDKIESSAKFRMQPMSLEFLKEQGIIIEDIRAGGNHCLGSGYASQIV